MHVLVRLRRRIGFAAVAAAIGTAAVVAGPAVPALALSAPISGLAATPDRQGYWQVARDGGVFTFGDATFYGSMGGISLPAPIIGMAARPQGDGYWLVSSSGGIYSFGNAPFRGSITFALNQPIVGMAVTPSGGGYWLVAADGGIFAFGDAVYRGSMGGTPLNKPVVGMAATPDGGGYWEVAADGGIFAFGNAGFYGSTGSITLNKPIVGMARTGNGAGYWLVASDGGIFAFGNAGFYGSTGGMTLNYPVVAIAAGPFDQGYWTTAQDGGLFAFGSAKFYGSMFDGNPQWGNQPPAEDQLRTAIVNEATYWLNRPTVSNGSTCFTTDGSCNSWAWCAEFASYVWIKAGVNDWPWQKAVYRIREQAQASGRWRARTDRPKPGDLAVYEGTEPDGDPISHVNIVTEVRSTDGWIRSIGGNQGTSAHGAVTWHDWENPLTVRYSSLKGYATPVSLSGTAHAAWAQYQDVGTPETGGDFRPLVSVSDATVNEAAGAASFTVSLDVATSEPVAIQYATSDGTARAGSDYTAKSGTVTVPAYAASTTITVPVTSDALYEGNETFSLALVANGQTDIVDGAGVATIVDDDPRPVVAAGDASVQEGDSGSRAVTFPVTLSAPSGLPVTVSYATAYGSASSSDLTAVSGTVTIAAGATNAMVAVPVTGDTSKEAAETFTLTLSAPVNATLGRSGTGTILDDDRGPQLRLSAGDGAVVEGTLGTRQLVFTVSLSQPAPTAVTVSYATASGTATSGTDFVAASGSVSIPAGSLSATVVVTVNGDATVEPDETFALTLSNAVGATLDRAVGTGTIRNDD